jgi:predicted Rossmann-fold nucleotide-binding protein
MCSDLSDTDCDIVTGGGAGLMQVANAGTRSGLAKRRRQEHWHPGAPAL